MRRVSVRFIVFLALIILSTALLAACDDVAVDDISYAPEYYGENGKCYYAYDAGEFQYLRDAGLCPHNWIAAPMPILWHETYYSYYSSSSYYSYYMPSNKRKDYQTKIIVQFKNDHASDINKYSNSGTWKGSDGKQYNGKTVTTQVKQKKAGFFGGSARQTTKPAPPTTKKTTSPPSTTTKTKPAKPPVTTKPISKSTGSTSTSTGFKSGGARKK